MALTPEERARQTIDGLLSQAGWTVQDRKQANIDAAPGVAIREFSLGKGYAEPDYLLFVHEQAMGVVEAKKEGTALVGAEIHTQKYSGGIPEALPAPVRPLPFCYLDGSSLWLVRSESLRCRGGDRYRVTGKSDRTPSRRPRCPSCRPLPQCSVNECIGLNSAIEKCFRAQSTETIRPGEAANQRLCG